MKKNLIVMLAVIILVLSGCSKTTDIEESDNNKDTTDIALESFIAVGIVSQVNGNMVTLVNVNGKIGADDTIVVLISDETKWQIIEQDITFGLTMTVELSAMMTRSMPPQSNAISIISLENILYGKVLDVQADRIFVQSTNEYSYFDEVILLFTDETIWDVEKNTIKVDMSVKIIPSDVMTMSIPPQTAAIRVISAK